MDKIVCGSLFPCHGNNKIIFAAVFVALFLLTGVVGAYSGGDGSEVSPYQISNSAELKALSEDFGNWTENFILTADISLAEGSPTETIGKNNDGSRFTGSFDGQGYTISNFVMNKSQNCVGLFGCVGTGGEIMDLGIEAGVGGVSGFWGVGVLAGQNQGTITNCSATGNATATTENVGGLVGYNSGSLENCYATGDATSVSSNNAGGLVGMNDGGSVTNCYATGNATADVDFAGGLVGLNSLSATITNCYATGDATATHDYAGGLVGENNGGKCSITNCYATGNATAPTNAGGLIGKNFVGSTITNCYRYADYGNDEVTRIPDLWKFKDIEFITRNEISNGLNWSEDIISTSSNPFKIWFVNSSKTEYPTFQHPYSGRSGSSEDPYLISTREDVIYLSTDSDNWDKYFRVTADIDLDGGCPASTIGNDITKFTGSFDGQGYTIRNFSLSIDGDNVGLFGYVGSSGEIRNLNVETDANGVHGQKKVGVVVGTNFGILMNCSGTGSATADSDAGDLVGKNEGGTIRNCSATGIANVTATGTSAGGLVGWNDGGFVTNCSAASTVTVATGSSAGGLAGCNDNGGSITNCSATGTATGSNAGNLVGYNSGSLENCYATGNATATTDAIGAGGLVGKNIGTITNCYATGTAAADGINAGGLVGDNDGGSLENCFATGNATATNTGYYAGGLVGSNSAGSTITNCYATGSATAAVSAGGLVGSNEASITNCSATGSATSTDSYAGGLVGANGGSLENCSAMGDATAAGNHAGGLVGLNNAGSTITNCYATGDATANNSYAGGLVGSNEASITNSYATGNATVTGDYAGGEFDAGGLVGANTGEGSITNCYATGNATATATATTHTGGLVGSNADTSKITNCYCYYADGATGVTRKSDTTLFKNCTFLTGNGGEGNGLAWSIDNISTEADSTKIWRVSEYKSYYPIFQWQSHGNGTLQVNSTPDGAAISLNGESTGKNTNHTFSDLPEGVYNITVECAGYTSAPEFSVVNLTAGETKEVAFSLTPIVVHPPIWNVSHIAGVGNYTNVSAIPEISDGDTIRIWGTDGHTYEGGFTITAANVTIQQWEGSPVRPLVTNTLHTAPAINITADNVTLTCLNISGNTPVDDISGAGVRATGTSGAPLEKLTITNCLFTGNVVTSTDYGGGGGGIYADYTNNITLGDTVFSANSAAGNMDGGGALFNSSKWAQICNTSFYGNTARAGAALCLVSSNNAAILNTTFEQNTGVFGNLFFNGGGSVTIRNSLFNNTKNIWVMTHSPGTLNYSSLISETNIVGGPYLGGNVWLTDPDMNISEYGTDANYDGICDSPFVIKRVCLLGTDAYPLIYGGSVQINSTITGANVSIDGTDTCILTNRSFYLPVGEHTISVAKDGCFTPDAQTVTITNAGPNAPVTFSPAPIVHPALWNVSHIGVGNYTNVSAIPEIGDGDTIRIWGTDGHTYEGGFTITAANVTIQQWEGSPVRPLITDTSHNASTITVRADNAILQGLNISNNTYEGDGAGVSASGTDDIHLAGFTITDCFFTGNGVTINSTNGGAVRLEYTDTCAITGTTFMNNSAECGSGAYFSDCPGLTLTDTTFENNIRTDGMGGGVYVTSCDGIHLIRTTFRNNCAYECGGASFSCCTGPALTDTTFGNNTGGFSGGAYFNSCDGTRLIRTSFTGNTATEEFGGGVYLDMSENAYLDNTIFENNSAAVSGGGLFFLSSPNAVVRNSTIVRNSAVNGGGCYIDAGSNDVAFTNVAAATNTGADFAANGDCTGVSVTNLTLGDGDTTAVSFTFGGDMAISGTTGVPLAEPVGYGNISHFVNVTAPGWMLLNVSYTDADVAGVNVSGLSMWRTTDDVWEEVTGTNGVNTAEKYVYAALVGLSDWHTVGPLADVAGELRINSTPANACIWLDGVNTDKYTNTTPLNVSTGLHNVTVKKDGYLTPVNHSVTVEMNEVTDVFFALIPVGSKPVPSFTGTPLSGDAPLQVTFTDTSTEAPQLWNWSFGDGNFSEVQNPVHTYAEDGVYDVRLITANFYGDATVTKNDYVIISGTPAIRLTAPSGRIPAGDTVVFPVITDHLDGITNLTFAITYDPDVITVEEITLTALTEGSDFEITLDNTEGLATVIIDNTSGITAVTEAAVAEIAFRASDTIAGLRETTALTIVDAYAEKDGDESPVVCVDGVINAEARTELEVPDGSLPVESSEYLTVCASGLNDVKNFSFIMEFNRTVMSVTDVRANGTLPGLSVDSTIINENGWLEVSAEAPDTITGIESIPLIDINMHSNGLPGEYEIRLVNPCWTRDNTTYNFDDLKPGIISITPVDAEFTDDQQVAVSNMTFNDDTREVSINLTKNLNATVTNDNTTILVKNPGIDITIRTSGLENISSEWTGECTGAEIGNISGAADLGGDVGNVSTGISADISGGLSALMNPDTGLDVTITRGAVNETMGRAFQLGVLDQMGAELEEVAYTMEINKSAFSGITVTDAVIVMSAPELYVNAWGGADNFTILSLSSDGTVTHLTTSNTYADGIYTFTALSPEGFSFKALVSFTVNEEPMATFSAVPVEGMAPLAVQFYDYSGGRPTSWSWDFGDGNTSVEQNPVHLYTAVGEYDISLTVTNVVGEDTVEEAGYITVTNPMTVNFSASRISGYAPLTVTFTDGTSGNPSSWLWEFGDGETSVEQNPVHTYGRAGVYSVSLTATNAHGSKTAEKERFVTVSYPNDGGDSDDSTPFVKQTPTPTPVPMTGIPTAEPTTVISPTPAVTNPNEFSGTAGLPVGLDGTTQRSVTIRADDTSGYLTIDAGVVARDASGILQENISIVAVPVTTIPSPGEVGAIKHPRALYAYACTPEGVTFTPAISLTFTLSEDEWNLYGNEAEVGWFNSTNGEWEIIAGVTDAAKRSITISVSHFSTYALFAEVAPEVALPDMTGMPAGSSAGSALWLWGGFLIVVIAAGVILFSSRRKEE